MMKKKNKKKYLIQFYTLVILLQNGEVYSFGSNIYGQLGVGDLIAHAGPVQVKLPSLATQVAAGSNHTVVLTAKGEVYTFGAYQVSTYCFITFKGTPNDSRFNRFIDNS